MKMENWLEEMTIEIADILNQEARRSGLLKKGKKICCKLRIVQSGATTENVYPIKVTTEDFKQILELNWRDPHKKVLIMLSEKNPTPTERPGELPWWSMEYQAQINSFFRKDGHPWRVVMVGQFGNHMVHLGSTIKNEKNPLRTIYYNSKNC